MPRVQPLSLVWKEWRHVSASEAVLAEEKRIVVEGVVVVVAIVAVVEGMVSLGVLEEDLLLVLQCAPVLLVSQQCSLRVCWWLCLVVLSSCMVPHPEEILRERERIYTIPLMERTRLEGCPAMCNIQRTCQKPHWYQLQQGSMPC